MLNKALIYRAGVAMMGHDGGDAEVIEAEIERVNARLRELSQRYWVAEDLTESNTRRHERASEPLSQICS